MIGRLTGRIDSVGKDRAILDVGGVGYLLACSARTLRALERDGGDVSMFVETVIRDDRIVLYGFRDQAEQNCFRALTSVQGVGARVALAVLSTLTPGQLVEAVAAQDRAAVGRASGVGPRLAQRVVTELRERLAELDSTATVHPTADSSAETDAVLALVNLGYSRAEAFRAVAAARRQTGADDDTATLVRAALRELAQ